MRIGKGSLELQREKLIKREIEDAEERIKDLVPVKREELEQLAASQKFVDVDVLVRGGNKLIPERHSGKFLLARDLHQGRAEDAPLHDMLYGGYCLVRPNIPGEIVNIYPPDEARKSPLSPKVLRIYHDKEGGYVIDRPITDFTSPPHH